ncbi:MAG: hypothetical protein ABL921_06200 [Pirellula sp.]
MKLDLSKDKAKIIKYIRQRIKDYPLYVNCGPGEDADPIRFITLGFYAEQAGYIALIFDTRNDADYDGEWTNYLDEPNMLDFPKWCEFYEMACDGNPVSIVLGDGTTESVLFADANKEGGLSEKSLRRLNAYFGDMLKDVLCELKDDGSLSKLPLTKDAFMMVIDFDELYLWPKYEKRKAIGKILQ